jgi:hypothetical protein
MIIFDKVYYCESLYDLGRDIDEAIEESYELPKDEEGFILGKFKVTIEWSGPE